MKAGESKWNDQRKIDLFYEYLNNDIGMDQLSAKYSLHKGTVVRYIHYVLDTELVPIEDIDMGRIRIKERRKHLVLPKSEEERKKEKEIYESVQGSQWDEWSRSMGML